MVKATVTPYSYPQGADNTQRNFILRGTIVVSSTNGTSDAYPSGGFPISWTTAASGAGLNSSGVAGYAAIPSQWVGVSIDSVHGNVTKLPTQVLAWSASNPPSGLQWVVDHVVGNLHAMVPSGTVSGSPADYDLPVEYSGNVGATILNDIIAFEAIFPLADV